MSEMNRNIVETDPQLSRKRKLQKSEWKSTKEKNARYSPKQPPKITLPCKHYSKAYRCSSLRKSDITNFHAAFYKTRNKLDQDNFILQHTKASPVIRRRPKTGSGNKKNINIVYYARRRHVKIPICRKTFLSILNVKKGRVIGVISRNYLSNDEPAKETRGGDRKKEKFHEVRNSIKEFLKQLVPLEIHYCRSKIKHRQYLSSDLNINKLFKMYKQQAEEQFCTVKASYFRRVFNSSFNIGFGTPQTDKCSTCLVLTERIKHEKDVSLKNTLIIEKRIHTLRAKAFYSLLKEAEQGTLIFSFDCQKNQPLPKVPDQSAYFSRQLYVYNFTVVVGTSKSNLTKENVFIYTWTEELYPKASNEIASALFHCLCTNLKYYIDVKTIRLVADGCGGQNKNSAILGMVSKYLLDYAPPSVKTIEINFPVVGHSFLPPDRVFAQIEKKIKKTETISNPEGYFNIFKEHGTVFNLGAGDVLVEKWKEASSSVLKSTGNMHFSFNKCKRFFIKRNKEKTNAIVRAEQSYNNIQGQFKNICKHGKNIHLINPEREHKNVAIKDLKLQDVKKLLKTHYGDNWEQLPELEYYKNVFTRDPEDITHLTAHEECESQEETQGLVL